MNDNKQQTAVEWFWNQLPEILPFTVDTETAVKLQEAYKQAKEIGKEQHGKTWDHAMESMKARGGNDMRAYTDFDGYYAETYGGNNE